MTTFTPNILIDNLNKNIGKIIGHSIKGYYEFYKMEQLLLTSIQTNKKQNKNQNIGKNKKIFAFLETYATIIQYGKSYFADQIITNLTEIETQVLYINTVSPLISHKPKIGYVEELTGGQHGGSNQLIKMFISLAIQLLFASLANSTSIANSISLYGQTSEVAINIDKGQIPKARTGMYDTLNPSNTSQMEQMTQEFGSNVVFPQDTLIKSVNLVELYSPDFIAKMKGSQGIWDKLLNLYQDDQFNDLFYSNISARVEYVNSLVDIVHPALEDMCRGLVQTTDKLLPIRLYDLLNSKLASEFQRIKDTRDELIENKISELKSDKLNELQITEAEPDIFDLVKEDVDKTTSQLSSGVSSFFSWMTTSKQQPDTTQTTDLKTITATELQDIYTRVDESVSKQIQELGNRFEQEAFSNLANEKLLELQEQTIDALSVTNLQIYLSSVCKIKKPKYMFNQASGVVYIKNPARSRTHLMVLAKNVISYYDTVIKGIQQVGKNGEIFIDIPDEVRILNLNSLLEKSQSILPVLVQYDTEIVSSLTEGHEASSNINEFFENIIKMWIDIKDPIIQATQHFPVTSKNKKMELERKDEASQLEQKEIKRIHDIEIEQRQSIVIQNRELNEVSKEEWVEFNGWVGINVEGGLNTAEQTASAIVNSTTQVGTNILENSNKLLNTGMASIMSVAWGISKTGMIFFIPALLFIAMKTGFVSAVFKNIKRRIEPGTTPTSVIGTTPTFGPGPALGSRPTVAPGPTYGPGPAFGSTPTLGSRPAFGSTTAPVFIANYNRIRARPAINDDDLSSMLSGMDINKPTPRRGGKQNKTKKHNKMKTHKSKRGKKRQSRHKKGRPTKKR